ncbi:low temperature requirement protein A [Listeria booriae]|uniref:Low temperature requirement protein A n=1 Tax=Listeria booriae TaxID=1552123 RepID=A0A7X1DJE9_9LIST|nr:low temperature requirement protein A [Listeria booriae]MBC2285670.1 low temperature requirement protein A [Listeria booriae]MBC2293586.1 low temperature requirement protein A [Listeria booriae]MBC2303811.1 low temperature requirement protein A [Listeria booriae]MBC2309745.1 low temperature requirement protein A [Listeria booriae]
MPKKVTWLELFFDLLFVGAIASVTHVLLHIEHGVLEWSVFWKFVLMFVPLWWAWTGQTLFINRYGNDLLPQRLLIALEIMFVLLMISSFNLNFDATYITFFIGYIGLRMITAIQYLFAAKKEQAERRGAALFLGKYFWIGILVSSISLFLDSEWRYVVLYLGIALDIVVPIIGRKKLRQVPIHTEHLLERFGLFTIILLGESIVAVISLLSEEVMNVSSICYAASAIILVLLIWWQYFDNLEKKLDKEMKTAGQLIIYGHLFLFLSLSTTAAAIKMLVFPNIAYHFVILFLFGSILIYVLAFSATFHLYRVPEERLAWIHLGFFIALLLLLFSIAWFVVLAPAIILLLLCVFFLFFGWITSK